MHFPGDDGGHGPIADEGGLGSTGGLDGPAIGQRASDDGHGWFSSAVVLRRRNSTVDVHDIVGHTRRTYKSFCDL
ncbi:hypothetical protein GCM10009674_24130 [Nesterenkonia xinjiangensis]